MEAPSGQKQSARKHKINDENSTSTFQCIQPFSHHFKCMGAQCQVQEPTEAMQRSSQAVRNKYEATVHVTGTDDCAQIAIQITF